MTINVYMDYIKKVTLEDVSRVAQNLFIPEQTNLCLIGNIEQETADKYLVSQMNKFSESLKKKGGYYPKKYQTPKWYAY